MPRQQAWGEAGTMEAHGPAQSAAIQSARTRPPAERRWRVRAVEDGAGICTMLLDLSGSVAGRISGQVRHFVPEILQGSRRLIARRSSAVAYRLPAHPPVT